MNENVVFYFIIYAILFRLSIIGAGITSIILGYSLFCKGVGWNNSSSNRTSVDVKIASSRFTLKNATPGICFALFGVLIIVAMCLIGEPSLTLKTLQQMSNNSLDLKEQKVVKELRVKGKQTSSSHSIYYYLKEGLDYEKQKKDTLKAIDAYKKCIGLITAPMNNLAWLYLKQNKAKNALPLAQFAVQIFPENPDYLHTYAEILFEMGNRQEALGIMEKAAKLKPIYNSRLKELMKKR